MIGYRQYSVRAVTATVLLAMALIGCSTTQTLTRARFLQEVDQLAPGTKIKVWDRDRQPHTGVLASVSVRAQDSARVVAFAPDNKMLFVAPAFAPGEIVKVSCQRKTTANQVLTAGMLGMIGGAVLGAWTGQAVRPQHEDTPAYPVLGGAVGAVAGFATGAILVNALPGRRVLLLEEPPSQGR